MTRDVIRPYESGDRDDLLDVWETSARVAYPWWTQEMFARERRDIAETYLPIAETYVCEREGAVVAFLSLLGTEVGGIFVAPAHQRRGIATALLDRARGRGPLELDVFETNEAARAFYATYGFRVVAERTDSATGERVLRLRLPPPE